MTEDKSLINNVLIDDVIPRFVEKNFYNYSSLQLATRKKAIRDAEKDYPSVSPKFIEWMYDVIENKPKDEVEDIINNKLWETKAKPRMHGGIINDSMEIITDDNIEIKTEV
tara:strand:- start:901 stop:1233 length:333 start_codon:yes stop_codon:yes gene_type:complete